LGRLMVMTVLSGCDKVADSARRNPRELVGWLA
jgi:hypothetical protein